MKIRIGILASILGALLMVAPPLARAEGITRLTGQVVGIQTGKAVILRLDDGRILSFMLTPGLTFPVDLATGLRVSVGVRDINGVPSIIDMILASRLTSAQAARLKARHGGGARTIGTTDQFADSQLLASSRQAVTGSNAGTRFADEAMVEASREALPGGAASVVSAAPGFATGPTSMTVEELNAQVPNRITSATVDQLRSMAASATRPSAVKGGNASGGSANAANQAGVTRTSGSFGGGAGNGATAAIGGSR